MPRIRQRERGETVGRDNTLALRLAQWEFRLGGGEGGERACVFGIWEVEWREISLAKRGLMFFFTRKTHMRAASLHRRIIVVAPPTLRAYIGGQRSRALCLRSFLSAAAAGVIETIPFEVGITEKTKRRCVLGILVIIEGVAALLSVVLTRRHSRESDVKSRDGPFSAGEVAWTRRRVALLSMLCECEL